MFTTVLPRLVKVFNIGSSRRVGPLGIGIAENRSVSLNPGLAGVGVSTGVSANRSIPGLVVTGVTVSDVSAKRSTAIAGVTYWDTSYCTLRLFHRVLFDSKS